MKKIVIRRIVVFAFVLAAGLALALPSVATATQVKATGNVNVRSGPGTNYVKLGQLTKDQVVTSTGSTGSWTQIEYQDGTAYVSSVYVMAVSASGSTSSNSSALGSLTATGNVNVRTGPGTGNSKLGQLKKGQSVSYTGMSGGWYAIEYEDGTAYVIADYVRVTSSSASSGSSGSSGSGSQMEATGNVNVRSGPGTNYSKLGQLKRGQTISNQGTSGNWVKTTYNGKTAYVSKDYLIEIISNTTPAATPTPTPAATSKVYAIRSTTVRTSTATNATVVGYLDSGDSVTYLGDEGVWYKVQLGSHAGYVLASDMQKTDPNTSMPIINAYRTASQDYVPYYSSMVVTSTPLGYVYKNENIFVQAGNASWMKCTVGSQTVYIEARYLGGATNGYVTVNEYRQTLSANVSYYATASTSSTSLGKLAANQNVYVYAIDSTWAQCNIGNQTVYIQLVYLSGGTGNASGMTSVSEIRTTIYDNAPYYDGMSVIANLIGRLSMGQSVQVTAVDSTWAKCLINNQSVYIQLAYLSGGTGTASGMTAVNANRTTLYDNIPYYSTANSSTAPLNILAKNQSVYVYAMNSTWAQCNIGNQTVYIQSNFLSGSTTSGNGGTMTAMSAWRYAIRAGVPCYSSMVASNSTGTLQLNEKVYVSMANTIWADCTVWDNANNPVRVYILLTDLKTTI